MHTFSKNKKLHFTNEILREKLYHRNKLVKYPGIVMTYEYNMLLKSIPNTFDFILIEYILLYIYILVCYIVYIYRFILVYI